MGCMISQISGISLRPSLGDPSRWLPFHVAEAVNGRDFVSPKKTAGNRDESGNLMYFEMCINQWPFQDPKLEVPTIYKAYVRGYPPKIWPYMVQYLHFRILEFPLNKYI